MKNIIILALLVCLPFSAFTTWLDEVNAIHAEIGELTANVQELTDSQRLERYYQLSFDLAMLESAIGLPDRG